MALSSANVSTFGTIWTSFKPVAMIAVQIVAFQKMNAIQMDAGAARILPEGSGSSFQHHILVFPQTELAMRGSNGCVKGP